MKKLITALLALTTVFGTVGGFSACGRAEGEKFDEKKSHLYIGIYNAGYGDEYAKDLKARFEAFYATESFEAGKTGVQVHISDVAQGNALVDKIAVSTAAEVFFTSNLDYYQYVDRGLVLNIDDVVTDKLNKYGENSSIEDRMDKNVADFYKTDNGYYAVPYVASYSGMAMNVDLFEEKELYFAKGGCPSEYLRTNSACDPALEGEWDESMYVFTGKGEKSAGPDGKYGTSDDGEPATYEEFFAFCEHCYDSDVQAFHWPGKYDWTFSQPMIQMIADYEGAEQMALNYSFKGTAKSLIQVDEDGTVTKLPDTEITSATGYKLAQQAGKYYVLDFVEKLLQNKKYYNEGLSLKNKAHTHRDAQTDFVAGGHLPKQKEIALLVDGEWWWNEAQPSFDTVATYTNGKYTAENRRFKMLSFPKATNEKVGDPFTVLIDSTSVCAINASIPSSKIKMAKEFVKFAFTNASNLQFTKLTSCARPFDYEYSDGYLEGLNYFQKSVVETYAKASECFVGSKSKLYIYNSFDFFNMENFWATKIGNSDFDMPVTAFARNGKTAIEYFNGLQKVKNKENWDYEYSRYYE